jgi:VWFA-related protein
MAIAKIWLVGLVLASGVGGIGQLPTALGQEAGQRGPVQQSDPALVKRPPPRKPGAVAQEGGVRLDVVVKDASGKAVTDLNPWGFKVLDGDQPRKILSFRSFDGAAVKPDPPTEVILLVDLVNPAFQQTARIRQQIQEFLTRDGGHLAHPVSIMLLTEAGLRIQPRPSDDGNALLGVLDQIKPSVRVHSVAMGEAGSVLRMQASVKALAMIASNEANRPGRKILVWIGSGWPILAREDALTTPVEERNQRLNFSSIASISNWLREGQVTIYSLGGGSEFFYKDYLKGLTDPAKTRTPNLALQVFAVHTGGTTIDVGSGTDIANQIVKCLEDADTYYRISFDPPVAKHVDEYHDLKVVVDRPGMVVSTSYGYYNELQAGAAPVRTN